MTGHLLQFHGPPREHALWTLSKAGHQVLATVSMTPFGPEIRIAIDGELFWSHMYRGATGELLAAEADRKREEFEAKGWTIYGQE